ncbi:MAG: hypothetical protein ACRCTI_05890, partial [Beijerinckiaceae bacterium]
MADASRLHTNGVRPNAIRVAFLMASVAAASLLLIAPVRSQGILRGTTEEDVITRIGRTSGDAQRNATPTGRRASPQVRLGDQDTRADGSPLVDGRGRPVTRAARSAGQRRLGQRPRQQNFRSLERPLNTAVQAPAGDQEVAPGLPPPPPQRRNARPADDPYAPLGLRLGTITVFPT